MVKNRRGKIRIHNPKYTRPFTIFLTAFTVITLIMAYRVPYDWLTLISRTRNLMDAIRPLMEIDFSEIDLIFPFFLETVWIAVLATIYSAILGVFFAVFMARNITPVKFLPPILAAVFTFIRAVPSFIIVLLLIVSIGLGTTPAILGITINSTAFFARAFAHAFEELDGGILEALASTGANRTKVFFTAVLPSSFTMLIAWLTLNFESNFQSSTILGMVGAGGVGFLISMAFSSYNFGRAWMAVLTVVLFAYVFEILSNGLKRKLKEGK